MANKIATVFVLDVGPSMSQPSYFDSSSSKLKKAIKVIKSILNMKLIAGRKTDQVGIVIFGCDETNNHLSDDGYSNISVLRDVTIADLDMMRQLNSLVCGSESADLFDAIIVGLDIIKIHCKHYKYTKKLFVISDAESEFNQNDCGAITTMAAENSINIDFVGVDFDDLENGIVQKDKPETKAKNETFITNLVETMQGQLFCLQEAIALLSDFLPKTVRPVTTFRGYLSLGYDPSQHILPTSEGLEKSLVISIWMYPRTSIQAIPSSKKLSSVSEKSTDIPNDQKTMLVNMERKYRLLDDSSMDDIPMPNLVKAYRYGKDWIPIHQIDEEAMRLQTVKGLSLLGFIKEVEFSREYCISNTMAIVADPTERSDGVALSSLIHALYEKELLALVRYVRSEDAPPKLGVLKPHITTEYECLYYCQVPYADDIRRFILPPLLTKHSQKKFKSEHEPSLLDLTKSFITEMDLDQVNPQFAKPSTTFNPVLHRVWECIQHRALYPESSLPPVDPKLLKQISTPLNLKEKVQPTLAKLAELFGVKKVEEKSKKSTQKAWADSSSKTPNLDILLDRPEETANINLGVSLEDMVAVDIRHVGTADPVKDFTAMVQRRDEDLVSEAVQQMAVVIEKFVEESFGDQYYNKIMTCLNVLRSTCIQENESESYNQLLRNLRENSLPLRQDLWKRIIKADLSLITNIEAKDSTVDDDEASQFVEFLLEKTPLPTAQPEKDEEEFDADDLLGMME